MVGGGGGRWWEVGGGERWRRRPSSSAHAYVHFYSSRVAPRLHLRVRIRRKTSTKRVATNRRWGRSAHLLLLFLEEEEVGPPFPPALPGRGPRQEDHVASTPHLSTTARASCFSRSCFRGGHFPVLLPYQVYRGPFAGETNA